MSADVGGGTSRIWAGAGGSGGVQRLFCVAMNAALDVSSAQPRQLTLTGSEPRNPCLVGVGGDLAEALGGYPLCVAR